MIDLIKGNEAANAESINLRLSAIDETKSNKSVLVDYVLLAKNWQGVKAPYSYRIENVNVTATSNQEVLPALTITKKDLAELQSINLTDGGQDVGYFVLNANAKKPRKDIPIRIIYRGDM